MPATVTLGRSGASGATLNLASMCRSKLPGLAPVKKSFVHGTHRARPPAETVSNVRAHLREMGVTRFANVTHLDRVGIPVVIAVRPNSRSVSIAMGKGVTLAAAQASAAMEAIESHHAETMQVPLIQSAHDELPKEHQISNPDLLCGPGASKFDRSAQLDWMRGIDLLTGRRVLVPFDLVHIDYTRLLGRGGIWPESNGLASGNHLVEALDAAISEVVERDAVALWLATPKDRRRRLDNSSVTNEQCREVIATFQQVGLKVVIWDITSDIGIPTFACRLLDYMDRDLASLGPFRGSGCHPSRDIALLRALTEAAQVRLAYIVGARDDLDPGEYFRGGNRDLVARAEEHFASDYSQTAYSSVPNFVSDTLNEDLAWQLDRIAAAGLEHVVGVDLTRPEYDISVVRVVIPGMGRGLHHHASAAVGRVRTPAVRVP